MEYIRVRSIEEPHFAAMHRLMSSIFPAEEVLEFDLWKEPIEDPDIHVYVALHEGNVVGATEYRYYPDLRVAMTDFTIIGVMGLGIGRFLYVQRAQDLERLQRESGTSSIGMFAEIYRPHAVSSFKFGNVLPMHPAVRREVLSHIGYEKLDFAYVHPSWDHEGKAVTELDLGFLPTDETMRTLPAALIVRFLTTYYTALPNKPQEWLEMIRRLEDRTEIDLLPL
ncbi:GNAT family N-acetyltransferase [Cohnella cholangitidis]|uniref:GNAT family N-acetyltransferase n=1 Tax=Cohnella cholangitidis TaxID=2598458 RepID=A0A7G5C7N6_9BACL|nr:GNAT family N-acetyltransferase [Cohnella cholangitidis]QMV45220.1 GNAT family N-acetyltransferase [Cohnella cholangitidis]